MAHPFDFNLIIGGLTIQISLNYIWLWPVRTGYSKQWYRFLCFGFTYTPNYTSWWNKDEEE